MNRERIKFLFPLMQAFAEGKDLQARDKASKEWGDIDSPTWADDRDYRIKPNAPRFIFLIEDQDGKVYTGSNYTKERCDSIVLIWNKRAMDHRTYRTVEYKEVIPD